MSTIVSWKTTIVGEELSDAKLVWIRRNQQRLLKSFTPAERAFCRIFHKMVSRLPAWKIRFRYTRQKCFKVAPEILFFGDFYFKNLRLLVEIDGGSHLGPQAREKDRWRSRLISAYRGTSVLRLGNTEVLSGDFRAIEQRFIDTALSILPRSVGYQLRQDYGGMRDANPHIYADGNLLSTYQPKEG